MNKTNVATYLQFFVVFYILDVGNAVVQSVRCVLYNHWSQWFILLPNHSRKGSWSLWRKKVEVF